MPVPVDSCFVTRRPPLRDGDSGAVVPWTLVKIAAALALLGTSGYDAASVGWTTLQAEDAAGQCARSGSTTWASSRSVQQAYVEAARSAEDRDLTIRPEEFVVEQDGTVRVTVRGEAHTLVLRRVAVLRPWAVVQAEGSGHPGLDR